MKNERELVLRIEIEEVKKERRIKKFNDKVKVSVWEEKGEKGFFFNISEIDSTRIDKVLDSWWHWSQREFEVTFSDDQGVLFKCGFYSAGESELNTYSVFKICLGKAIARTYLPMRKRKKLISNY